MSSTVQRFDVADLPATPWKNGGGSTRELLAWPRAQDWSARLSVADVVSAGPFSSFPGIERWFAVLEGAGVALEVEGSEHRLGRDTDPFRFAGDAEVQCRLLEGPTRDFNLMAPPGRARMQRLRGAVDRSWSTPLLLALYTHDAPATLVRDEVRSEIPPCHLAWGLHEPGTLRIESADALWMEVQP